MAGDASLGLLTSQKDNFDIEDDILVYADAAIYAEANHIADKMVELLTIQKALSVQMETSECRLLHVCVDVSGSLNFYNNLSIRSRLVGIDGAIKKSLSMTLNESVLQHERNFMITSHSGARNV